jgi:hypothetical protein
VDDLTQSWLTELERTYLADLTTSEVARALRALSSCYVERRAKLEGGGALASAGKRAAFALFYAPQHFAIVRAIVRALGPDAAGARGIVDVGCGTGVAGIAWALETGATSIRGFDRHPWAVDAANAAYRHFRVGGRARRHDIATGVPAPRLWVPPGEVTGIVAAYTVNELTVAGRARLQAELLAAHERRARILIVEPISRRATPWWDDWRRAFDKVGGRSDDWRFPADLGATQQGLARAAGLDARELTARSLFV